MTTSVALCTYNGAKYIEEQLRSIIDQTHRVNEIVLCDDGSIDETLEIVEKIKQQTSDIDFKISVNKPNLGVCANFDKAIHECSGDIIFLSDQDDIWMKNKVEVILDWFEKNPDKSVVFTNGEFINSEGERFADNKLFDSVGLNKKGLRYFKRGLALELFLKANRATGATMALRKEFIGEFNILPDAKPGNRLPLHDEVIAFAAIAEDALGVISEPLIKYRTHSSQQVGLGSWIDNPPDISNAICLIIPNDNLFSRGVIPGKVVDRAQFGAKRVEFRHSTLGIQVLGHVREYWRYYRWLAFEVTIWDIAAVIFKKNIKK